MALEVVLWTSSSSALQRLSLVAQLKATSHSDHPNQPIVWDEGGNICLEETLQWQEMLSFVIEKH